jgi:hypothetical protein
MKYNGILFGKSKVDTGIFFHMFLVRTYAYAINHSVVSCYICKHCSSSTFSKRALKTSSWSDFPLPHMLFGTCRKRDGRSFEDVLVIQKALLLFVRDSILTLGHGLGE